LEANLCLSHQMLLNYIILHQESLLRLSSCQLTWPSLTNFRQMHRPQWSYHIVTVPHTPIGNPIVSLNVTAGSPQISLWTHQYQISRGRFVMRYAMVNNLISIQIHFLSLLTYVPEFCVVLPEKVSPWRVDEAVTNKHWKGHCNFQLTCIN